MNVKNKSKSDYKKMAGKICKKNNNIHYITKLK